MEAVCFYNDTESDNHIWPKFDSGFFFLKAVSITLYEHMFYLQVFAKAGLQQVAVGVVSNV